MIRDHFLSSKGFGGLTIQILPTKISRLCFWQARFLAAKW